MMPRERVPPNVLAQRLAVACLAGQEADRLGGTTPKREAIITLDFAVATLFTEFSESTSDALTRTLEARESAQHLLEKHSSALRVIADALKTRRQIDDETAATILGPGLPSDHLYKPRPTYDRRDTRPPVDMLKGHIEAGERLVACQECGELSELCDTCGLCNECCRCP
jgi:hypothetical protein